uniref:ABC transporter family G domain-containing protein n=1 Tax=Globisporangium ultimum (strain ATCC 200006 / CBS 805.95 / DAOM BR144) TaxID=431595 RepID=K3WE63_GLOUD
MKILSGRSPVKSSNIKVDGDIFYNDTFCDLIRKRLPQFVSYVTQQDVHHPSLTVEETMEFAYACCSSGLNKRVASVLKNDQLPVESMAARHTTTALLNQLPALVLELLGLQHCKNTVIGDAMLRGVSGGGRRRATTEEMLFGTKLALFMDDISTGLDSAATYDIVNMMRSLATSFDTTIAISLLQPSPEVFALFDDVLLLNGGHVMYHGPRDGAVNYFGDLGFICPPLRDVADFLLGMGTDEQSQYEVEARRSSVVTETPRTAAEFGSIFKLSSIHGDTLDALDELHSAEFLANAHAFTDVIPEFHQSYWDSTYHVFRREMLLLVRNSAFIKGRAFMIVHMGFLYSSIFYQIEPMKIQVMMGITFSATLFISLGQISQIPVLMAARDVFYKQRRSNFYRTSSLVVSSALSRVPVAIRRDRRERCVWKLIVLDVRLFQ